MLMTKFCYLPAVRARYGRRRLIGGFTIIELAVVLLIVAVLLSGLIMPITAQVERRHQADTQKSLDEIREALMGFAIANQRLPCPGNVDDPNSDDYGKEQYPCDIDPTVDGYLPWKTLGVAPLDAWGFTRSAAGQPRIGDWRYRVDRNFSKSFTLSTVPMTTTNGGLIVYDSGGTTKLTTEDNERPLAVVFSTGPDRTANGRNAPDAADLKFADFQAGEQTSAFDDLTIWISRPLLFSRMVASGRLP